MNGVFSFIRNLSLTKNHEVWSPVVSKLVDELKSVRTSQVQRSNILEALEPYVLQRSFRNTKEDDLLRGKADLLRLWDFLLRYMEVILQVQQKRKVFAFVVAIMDRKEFSLGALPKSASARASKMHLQFTQRYYALLVQTFVRVVKSAEAKANSPSDFMQFHAQAVAIFFFRLPLVGGRIVNVLEQKREEQIAARAIAAKSKADAEGQRDTNGKEDGSEDAKEDEKEEEENDENGVVAGGKKTDERKPKNEPAPPMRSNSPAVSTMKDSEFIKSNPDLFQWNSYHTVSVASVLEEYVNKEGSPGLLELLKNETFFLTFVEYFVCYVKNYSTEPIEWNVIPAYDLVVQCFLPLMRSAIWWDGIEKRQFDVGDGWVTSAPAYARVKITMLLLLKRNTELLNSYLEIIYSCTNIYSLWSVDSCVEHLGLCFGAVAEITLETEGKRVLPENFDFQYYWFGISKMLSSDLFQVILKVCALLYNTLDGFSGQHRVDLVTHLMTRSFFDLFLHWCTEVRTYFQLLLVYKILRSDRRKLPCFTDSTVLENHLEERGKGFRFPFNQGGQGDKVSLEQRMAVFDSSNSQDNEQLLIDIMLCSKIDAFVRMCLDNDKIIPEKCRPYLKPALASYAKILHKYYSGSSDSTYESLALLASKVVESPANPYLN